MTFNGPQPAAFLGNKNKNNNKKITDHDESLNVAKRLGAAEINSDLKHAVQLALRISFACE